MLQEEACRVIEEKVKVMLAGLEVLRGKLLEIERQLHEAIDLIGRTS